MKKILAVLFVLPLFACKPDCEKLKMAVDAACGSGATESAVCTAAKLAYESQCGGASCPATCPSGQVCTDPTIGCVPVVQPACPLDKPRLPDGTCPATCADYACEYGCTEATDGASCNPKPPATTCEPPCKANEKCVERGAAEKYYECVVIPGPTEAPLIPDEELTAVPHTDMKSQMWAETDAAIKRYQRLHPEKWIEKGGAQCLIAGPAGIDEAFLGVSTELLRQSIIAGQSISQSGQRSDCIFVNRTGGNLYEEMHIFDYSRACVATTQGAYKGLYVRSTGSVDPPDPPPVTTCPAEPCPLKTYPDGKAHWKFNSHAHTMGNADSTPVTVGQEPFCRATGQSPMDNGTPRASCPMRKEGDPERLPVENWLLDGGPVRDSKDGGDCTPNGTDNPYSFLMRGGNCRNCNTLKTVCTDWY